MQTHRQFEAEHRVLSTILQVTQAVQRATYRLDATLHIVLTGITARQGLGLNRAMVFLRSESQDRIEGTMGIGPLSPEDVEPIWPALESSDDSLQDLFWRYDPERANVTLNQALRQMVIPLDRRESPLIRTLEAQEARLLTAEALSDPELEPLGLSECAVVPLLSRVDPLGILIVDNVVSRKPLTEEDIQALRWFADQAAIAVENSCLYEALQEQVEKLHQAQQELRDSQKERIRMEQIAALGQMSGLLAHEIRNATCKIGGYAELLRRTLGGEDERLAWVDQIVQANRALEQLLAERVDLLGSTSARFEERSLPPLIETAFERVAQDLERAHIQVVRELPQDLPPLFLDEARIVQIFVHLFQNAIQAMPSGGTLTLRARQLEHLDRTWLEVCVEDTGSGIPPEQLERIFEPFFTTDRMRAGLGLTLAQVWVLEHGGTLHVESRPQQGTCVLIRLPIR